MHSELRVLHILCSNLAPIWSKTVAFCYIHLRVVAEYIVDFTLFLLTAVWCETGQNGFGTQESEVRILSPRPQNFLKSLDSSRLFSFVQTSAATVCQRWLKWVPAARFEDFGRSALLLFLETLEYGL